jgi:hypothetical protein
MPYDPENPFGEFEDVAKTTEAAGPMQSTGRLPVFANYKGVCTTVDLKGDGVMVDKEIFTARTGTKGLKIFLEILEPEEVDGIKVKGEIHEHVFWVTEGTIPALKRDVPVVTGKDWVSMAQLAKEKWAGLTVEFGLKDKMNNGFVRSEVSYFSPWKPGDQKAQSHPTDPKKGAAASATKGAAGAAKSSDQKAAAKGAASKVDF